MTGMSLAGLAVLAIFVASASAAAPSASLQETIYQAVRSVTVSPSSVAICPSSSPLIYPSGTCTSPEITITNGLAGGHMDVVGADAVPADNGLQQDWTLCGNTGQGYNCSGGNISTTPGNNQYLEQTEPFGGGTAATPLGYYAECDTAFDSGGTGCVTTSEEASNELIALTGPESSTDQSASFTTSVTWTAVP
jgi:hypothetical protein